MHVATPRLRRRRTAVLARAALIGLPAAVAACAGVGMSAATPSPLENRRWTTTLLSRSTTLPLRGDAMIGPTEERDGWRATVNVEGRGSNISVFGWRVMTGACGSTGTIVGSPVDYPAIQLGADGRATVEAEFDADDLRAGLHSVRVYATPAAQGQVVACGELREDR
jgi:hypothetical protein